MQNKNTGSDADMESSIGDELPRKEKVAPLATPCRIHLHSRRHRLTDADGCCYKYAIDGLVYAGLLPDDNPKCIKEISFSQEKIGPSQVEETIITIV